MLPSHRVTPTTPEKRYGVVYVLDADYSFAIARNVIEHLSDRDHLEPLIVVGIAYGGPPQYRLNRTRDYTPTHTLAGGYGPEMQKHSGGGARFRNFLAAELIPFIDATYRTIPGRRCLSGHSYGGLFTSWTLLTATEGLFDRYLIVSPSLWYDERMIFSLERRLNGASKPKGKVYLAVGSREGNRDRDMVEDLQRFASVLRRRDTLRVRHEVLTDETHNSVFPSAFSRGLRWLFDGR